MVTTGEKFCGDELCYECGREFPFVVTVPSKKIEITCSYCGAVQHPCSLCDTYMAECNSGTCEYWIAKSLEVANESGT